MSERALIRGKKNWWKKNKPDIKYTSIIFDSSLHESRKIIPNKTAQTTKNHNS